MLLPDTPTGARVAFYVLLGVFVLLEQRIRLRSALNRDGRHVDRGSLIAVLVAVGGGVGGAFVLASELPGTSFAGGVRAPLLVAGMVVMAGGIGLRQWSVALLGAYFTVDVRVQEGQTVVDRGPYRWTRHPSYTGLTLTLLGIGIALGNWLSLVCVAVLPLAGLLLRIRVEEAALLRELGEPYRRYAEGRARLFPYVW